MKAERYVSKPLLDWVCKSQKWVENANQPQLKPIIWYTSWYFSRGGKQISRGGKKKFGALRAKLKIFTPPPYRILISAPVKNTHFLMLISFGGRLRPPSPPPSLTTFRSVLYPILFRLWPPFLKAGSPPWGGDFFTLEEGYGPFKSTCWGLKHPEKWKP